MKEGRLLRAALAVATLSACHASPVPALRPREPAVLVTMVGCASCERALARLSRDARVITGDARLRVVVLAEDAADVAAVCDALPAAVPCGGDPGGSLRRALEVKVLPVLAWSGRRAEGEAVEIEIERFLWALR